MIKFLDWFRGGGTCNLELSAKFKDELSSRLKILERGEIIVPRNYDMKVERPPTNASYRCKYCDRLWDPTKYESCPGCGAPPEEAPVPGIRMMQVPDEEFYEYSDGEITKTERFQSGMLRKSFNCASVPSRSIAPVSDHGRIVSG